MRGYRLALCALALVAGCGGNPFLVEDDDGTPLDPEDPNTSVNSKFLWDPENDLTMNAVTYDPVNNQLVINNLPFDGPDGIYDNTLTLSNGARAYASRKTATTGRIQHYAVFIESGAMQATAAAGAEWVQYGNAGANINRSSFSLPTGIGEYVYAGTYAGLRTFDEKSGIELVTGDVTLLVDVLDFDPVDGIQGDIVGTVTNRTRVSTDGLDGRDLPNIFLAEVSFENTNGTFDEGEAYSFRPGSGDVWSEGTYSGLFGGTSGADLGGYLVVEGVADIQTVEYQVVRYQTDEGTFISSGLDTTTTETLQNQINAGLTLPSYLAAPGVPADATILADETLSLQMQTDYNAREIGVFVGEQR